MDPLKHRLLLLAALVLSVAVAAPALAEESTVDRAQSNPAGVALTEGTRVVDETSEDSIVRAFHEDWEGAADTIEDKGWSQEYVGSPDRDAPEDYFRLVHRQEDNPFRAPRATPIPAESPAHSVTTMQDTGTYVGKHDARLISPVLDLRYVRGISGSPSEPYRDEDVVQVLSDLEAAYAENRPDQYLFTSGYHELLFNPPSQWFPLPCPQSAPGSGCGSLEQGYDEDSRTRGSSGYAGDERRTPEACANPDFFFFSFGQCTPTTTVPVPGTRDFGLYADREGSVYAPNPADEREGLSYINLTFWHKWELQESDGVYLEVRERTADGSWSEWRFLEPADGWNQPVADPSSKHHEHTAGDRTMAYNGFHDSHRAFTGSSSGLVASTFNLNRFAGTEIQIAWRSSSVASANTLGWFMDDAVLWTNTYDRDVGVREVDRPTEGDRVAPDEPNRPTATVRNYGHLPVEDIEVTFRVTPSDDTDESFWTDTQTLEELGPQEEIEVASTDAFDPEAHLPGDPTGSYRLVANVTPYATPDDPAEENLTRRPETVPAVTNEENDERVVPFQVQAKPRADISIDVPEDSIQTDVGASKTFTVNMENTGNLPLAGTVEVTATRLDRTTLEPATEGRVIDRVRIRPGELPYGETLTSFGSEDNTWAQSFDWDEGLDEPGIYRLGATFESSEGRFEGSTPVYVRATPAPYYDEAAEALLDVSFSERSVYSAGMRVDSWTASASGSNPTLVTASPGLPDPVSPSHVWYGRGDDGGLGAARYGQSAEDAAGTDRDQNDTYDETEPDSFSQDPNYVDHYWLTREVNLTAYDEEDTRLVLTFWHSGKFNWSSSSVTNQREGDRSRARFEILPQDNAFLTDPSEEVNGTAPGAPETESGVDAVDERTPATDRNVTLVSGDAIYAQALETWESPVSWTQERIDLTPWKGEHVTLRFHLETSTSRRSVNSTDAGDLPPWLVDNIRLQAREEGDVRTVFDTDAEGDDWQRWSSSDGVRVEDPRSPVAVARSPGDKVVGSSLEGRGWQRYAYGETTLPSGWHLTDTRTRPEAGTDVRSRMFRWGDPTTIGDELPAEVNLSILETPEFSLSDARDPVLRFVQNHTFPNPPPGEGETCTDCPTTNDVYPHIGNENLDHVVAGGSVWIVGENEDGEEVKRELLVPADDSEARYDAPIANWYTENGQGSSAQRGNCKPVSSNGQEEPGANELHCETPLKQYPKPDTLEAENSSGPPAETQFLDGNVFTGKSGLGEDGRGASQWEQAVLDLSPYAEPANASLDYHVEFHAINQRKDKVEGLGWLVDDIQITERTFANDMAVDEIVRPADNEAVGPGLQIPVALRLQNQGLYDQVGVQASYRVLDASGDVVFGPVTEKTSSGKVIPGARSTENPDKNETMVFDSAWETPREEGTYVIEGEVSLDEAIPGHAFPDANPSNDVLRREIDVASRRSVGLLPAEELPDEDVVDPFVGTNETLRTFTVKVENKGTLPEVFTGDDAGDFAVNLTIRNAAGTVVKTSEIPIRRLAPGETRDVTFRSAWRPDGTGVYDITFRLDHPNETVSKSARDDVRSITYTVFNQILPRQGEDLASMFQADGAGWHLQDGSWRFGHGEEYRNDADDALVLKKPLEIRNLRRGLIRLNHSYAFEAGYDGGLLEVKPTDGDTWYAVPPEPLEEGYPLNVSSGSPFVDEPGGSTGALTGTSGDGGEPATQETAFNLAGVDPLVLESTIFEEDFEGATVTGTPRPDSVRYGNWSTEYLSRVEPRSGDTMWHSNATVAYPLNCWRHWTENNVTSGPDDCTLKNTLADSKKYLNVTFDRDFPPDQTPLNQRLDRDDVEALKVSFWDYRAIGLVHTAEGDDESHMRTRNEVSVQLTCEGDSCPSGATRNLDPVDPDSYDNNYRGWTRNVYEIPATALEPYTGPGKELRLSFVHHVMNGETSRAWSTDARSLHAGWFVDDVALDIVETDGDEVPYWSDDMEEYERFYIRGFDNNDTRTNEDPDDPSTSHNDPPNGRQEIVLSGPWGDDDDPGAVTFLDPTETVCGSGPACTLPRLLWDPVHAWGGEARCRLPDAEREVACDQLASGERENATKRHGLWRHVETGELPCGPLVDGADELAPEIDGGDQREYPKHYRASTTHFRACGPTGGHPDRAGGARLTTEVNLRPAVGDVTLAFDHEYRFRFPNQEPQVGRSGGRLEASVDGGDTWIPLQPISNETRPMQGQNETEETAQLATHTTFGGVEGDPEGDSIYGIGGQAWTGVSGIDRDIDDGAEPVTAKYDLSRFAGRKIQLAWHAYFGTHNFTQSTIVDQTGGAYEYWAIQNVEIDAEVLDADRLDLRLRAATDGSKTDRGWTVNDITMAGTNTGVNVGTEVLGLPAGDPVQEGDQGFSVSLENKGEQAARVDVDVRVLEVDADGSDLVFSANESDLRLPPQAHVERGTLGSRDLSVTLKAGKTYLVRSEVNVTDDDLRRLEAVRADNVDVLNVTDVRGASRLEVTRLTAAPNNVPGTGDQAIRVEADVLNDGFGSPAIEMPELALVFNRTTDDRPAVTFEGSGDLSVNPGESFRKPFQTKTYVWELPADRVGKLPEGIYDLELQVNLNTEAPDPEPEEVEPLYVGPSFFDERAYVQKVDAFNLNNINTCEYTNQDAQPPGGGETSGSTPTSATWKVTGESNFSEPRSFKWPVSGVQDPGRGGLTCTIDRLEPMGGTLRENLHLDFWTRYSFPRNSDVYNVSAGFHGECEAGDISGLPRFGIQERTETPGFTDDEYAHQSFALPEWEPGQAGSGCLSFEVREGSGRVYVDDVTVSPYSVELSPDDSVARVSDNTVKRFPFEVTNEGSFNDTFRFALVDETGRPDAGPRSWDFHVETRSGEPVEAVDVAAGATRSLFLVVDIPVQGISTSGTAGASLTALSTTDDIVRDTAEFTFRYDYPPRPNLDVIGTSVNNPDLAAGRPRSVTVTVANVGVEAAEDVPVSIVDRMPPRFGVAPNHLTTVDGQPLPNVTLEPGQTTTLIAGWTPTQAGPHNLTIQVDPDDDVVESDERDNVEVLDVPIESAKFPDLEVDIEVSDTEPEAGDSIAVNGTITNTGKAPAQGVRVTLRVGVSDLLEGEAPHILPQVIEPGETVRLETTWPASFPGDYNAFLKAIPLSGALEPSSTQDDNLDVTDVTVRSPGLRLEGPETAVNVSQGEEVLAPVTIENRGDTNETVDVTARAGGDLRGRIVSDGVSVTRVDVPRGNTTTLDLQVRTPAQVVADTYPVTVTVVSAKTGQTETLTVPVRVAPERGLSLEATAVDVDPGGGSLPVRLTNTGNVPTTVNVSAHRLPDGWSVDATTTLEPFSSKRVEADLQVPTDTPAGVRDLVVTARAHDTTAEAPVRVDVGTRGVLEIGMDPGEVAVRPGSTVTFNATLYSVGNVPAFPDLGVEAPSSWDVDLPRPRARIPEGESLAFQVTARIPEDANHGDHHLVLVADGEEETFTGNASVTVGVPDATVTNVEQNPRVNIEAGQNVTFTATLRNTGGLDLDEAGVGIYVDDALTDFGTVADVSAGARTEITMDWTAEAGEHVILLVADPGERINEEDEGNNARLLVVQVGGGAQVFGDVQRAVPAPAGLGLVALLGAALGRRWAS